MTGSTADIEEALEDYINEQRKQHRGCGSKEIMNKLLKLKPDALGGLPATVRPEEALAFSDVFKCWYQRFPKRRGFSIRRRTSVDQNLPTEHEGMAWATLMKLRKAIVECAGEIYARRNPPASVETPIKGEDLSPAQLESVNAEVFEELGNMDQASIQHEMPVETTLEKRGAKYARISTRRECDCIEVFSIDVLCGFDVVLFSIFVANVFCFFLCSTILLPSAPTSTT